jgi:DNA-binding beta-propeller fold protein YncE
MGAETAPVTVAITPDGKHAYVTNFGDGTRTLDSAHMAGDLSSDVRSGLAR